MRILRCGIVVLSLLLLTAAGYSQIIPQTKWMVKYVDSEETQCGSYGASNSFDGKPSTMWHTHWCNNANPGPPHEIQINLGALYNVNGFTYLPRQDGCANGWINRYNFYVSSDGANWIQVASNSAFNYGSATTTCPGASVPPAFQITFPAVTGQYVRLQALSEVNGNPWTSAAELNVLGTSVSPTTPRISQVGWTLKYVDSQETQCGSYGGVNSFDGNPSTMWHTQWCPTTAPLPHEIQINLGASYSLSGFQYLPRQDGCSNGWISQYEFYVSVDGVNWGTAVASGTFNYGNATIACPGASVPSAIQVSFPTTTGQYVRLRALGDVSGKEKTSMAEVNVLGTAASTSPISQVGWSLKYVDSQETQCGSYGAVNSFDGKTSTLWNTQWCPTTATLPHEIQINLGASYSLSGFQYLPRQDGCSHGWISQYEFYVSTDGVNWGTAVASGSFNYGNATIACPGASVPSAIRVSFPTVSGQYVRLRALREISGGNETSMAELSVFASATAVQPIAPSITTQPSNQTVTAGQTATFTVVATGTAPLSYQWQKNGAPISGATSASYTTPATTSADNGSQFRVVVSNSVGSVTSNAATLTITASSTTDVLTYHNDNPRTGQNLKETILTPNNVNTTTFGKVGFFSVDGKVDAQPLYASNLTIAGQIHNVLYVATEHDSLYAFDANTGAVLWKVSLLGSGETSSDNRGCDQVTPEIGITATPSIDRTRGPNGAIYVVAMSKDGSGNYFQRLHALDVVSGAELFGGPKNIQASFPGTGDNSSGGNVIFDPKQYKERSGLLLLNGVVYTTWASHCDFRPYTGWVIGFSASTLAQTSVLNVTPNGSDGAIWMSGAAPAADGGGNIYFIDGNGDFDTNLNANGFPSNGNFGNGFLKLSTVSGLAVADYFVTFDTVQQSGVDNDLGSGGALVLPDLTDSSGQVRRLAVGAGKDAKIYVVNRDAMGKFNPSTNNIYQEIQGALTGGVYSIPAYFNNTLYYGAVGDRIKALAITNAHIISTPSSQTINSFGYPGATPSISANGASNAIVWAVENGGTAVLHAYDATNVSRELYNSNQAGSRDQFGAGNKFITPTIVNGKVYVGTPNGVAVFGLLP